MSSLQAFTYGGSPASEELQRKIREKVKGSSAGQSFGMTETGSNNVTVYGEDFYRKPTSTGVPTPVNKVMIISDDDDKEFKPLPVNTVGAFSFGSGMNGADLGVTGEICIFGPNVVEGGYWRNPEATKKSFFAPGWYRTGGKVFGIASRNEHADCCSSRRRTDR